jgi:hypothetical protein
MSISAKTSITALPGHAEPTHVLTSSAVVKIAESLKNRAADQRVLI